MGSKQREEPTVGKPIGGSGSSRKPRACQSDGFYFHFEVGGRHLERWGGGEGCRGSERKRERTCKIFNVLSELRFCVGLCS